MKTIIKPEQKKNSIPTINLGIRPTVTVDGQDFKEVELNLTSDDTLAYREFDKYFYNQHKRYPSNAERINGILGIADSLDQLSIGDSEVPFMKQVKYVPVQRMDELLQEARKSKETFNNYMRAIYFSVGQYLKDKRIKEERESLKQAQTSRNIASTYYVTPVERKAIEAKHGAMSEKQLQDFLHKFARQQVKEVYGQ